MGEPSRSDFDMMIPGKSGLKSALRASITMVSKDLPTALMRPSIAWFDRRTLKNTSAALETQGLQTVTLMQSGMLHAWSHMSSRRYDWASTRLLQDLLGNHGHFQYLDHH